MTCNQILPSMYTFVAGELDERIQLVVNEKMEFEFRDKSKLIFFFRYFGTLGYRCTY